MSDERTRRYAEAMMAVPGASFEDFATAAMAVADAEQQAVASENERLCLENALLTQGLWDVWVALGHDTDGDTGPGAFIAGMGLGGFVRMVVSDATEYRRECEEEMERQYHVAQAAEAKVARLQALATWFEAQHNWREWGVHKQIRAALAGGS